MPVNTRTQVDGVWIDGYAPTASDWVDLERKIFNSWNGDKGGAYAASSEAGGTAYTIAGSGLQVTGPTRLSYGGAIKGGTGAFVIRDGAWPELATTHPARTRSIVCPIQSWHVGSYVRGASPNYQLQTRSYLWSTNHPYAGVGSIALACRATNSNTIETADLYIPVRVIDGAVLSSVTIYFRVATKRLLAPIAMPKLRIMRVPRNSGDVNGTTVPEPLKETEDETGFDFLPLVTTPGDWYNDGEVQSFTYVCDQNNTIDVENYSYLAHLVEEVGVTSESDPPDGIRLVERKQNVYAVGTNSVTLSGTQSFDQATGIGTGDRVLIVDNDDDLTTGATTSPTLSSKNGIWDASSGGDWSRASDLDGSDDFTPFWIVVCVAESGSGNFGGINNMTTWQCAYPGSNQTINLATAATATQTPFKTQPWIQPAIPRGNIYHSLVPTFEVSDLRFQ